MEAGGCARCMHTHTHAQTAEHALPQTTLAREADLIAGQPAQPAQLGASPGCPAAAGRRVAPSAPEGGAPPALCCVEWKEEEWSERVGEQRSCCCSAAALAARRQELPAYVGGRLPAAGQAGGLSVRLKQARARGCPRCGWMGRGPNPGESGGGGKAPSKRGNVRMGGGPATMTQVMGRMRGAKHCWAPGDDSAGAGAGVRRPGSGVTGPKRRCTHAVAVLSGKSLRTA